MRINKNVETKMSKYDSEILAGLSQTVIQDKLFEGYAILTLEKKNRANSNFQNVVSFSISLVYPFMPINHAFCRNAIGLKHILQKLK